MCLKRFDTLFLLILIVLLFIYWMKQKLTFWSRRGINTPKPKFFFGNVKELFFPRIQISHLFRQQYEYFKKLEVPHGGWYFMHLPIYMPVDPKIIKHIFQLDFPHFVSRGLYHNEESDPLSGHLVALEGQKWRNFRRSLTPAFTSAKMKAIFHEMHRLCEVLSNKISKVPQNTIGAKDTARRITVETIFSCGFRINSNLLDGEDEFLEQTEHVFEPLTNALFLLLFPNFMKKLRARQTKKSFSDFFTRLILQEVDLRKQSNIELDDFLGLLIKLKNNSTDGHKFKRNNNAMFTFSDFIAQAFIFNVAGFETTTGTLIFCLYELASSEHVQEKLRQDITKTYKKNGNKFTYNSIMEMAYVEQVVNETLRKYPPFPSILRKCTKDYTVPGTNLTLERGTRVTIPVIGLHYDEEYYPNPHVFDPDRFSKENKSKIPEFTFLPFGGGPRTCIGQRFAMMLVKVALCVILRKTKLTVSSKTKLPIEFDNLHFSLSPKNEIWLNCSQIDS